MSHDPCPKSAPPRERGFALVGVLWIAGLLAVMSATLALSVRTNIRVTANIIEGEKAQALADAGVNLAILDLLRTRQRRGAQRRFPLGGAVGCAVPGEGTLRIAVTDEAGKVDINSAGIPILQALLAGLGETPDSAARLADAIFDFRDADDDRRPNGAEAADYQAAGMAWGPKNAQFQSIHELGQVKGMSTDLVVRLRPHIGIHSGLAGIDPAFSSRTLIDVLRTGLQGASGSFGSFPEFGDTVALPAMFLTPTSQRFFSVRVEAQTVSGARFLRGAVVDIGSVQQAARTVLSWERLHDEGVQPTASGLELPSC